MAWFSLNFSNDVLTVTFDSPKQLTVINQVKPLIELAVTSIWKSLRVLQKARIDIVVVLFTLNLFFLIHTFSSSAGKWKVVMIAVFLTKLDHHITAQWYILQDYSNVSISFNMISKWYSLCIGYTMWVEICKVLNIIVLIRVKQSVLNKFEF